ncbi:MAG: DNA-3-methyladenine glycosylase family protein [Geminicoccaceae bacterium]
MASVQPLDRRRLDDGLAVLADRDPLIADALARYGPPAPRVRPPGFPTLLRIIVGQQISTRSAAAIWLRIETALGDDVSPAKLLALQPESHGDLGLTRQKLGYALGLAKAVAEGRFDPDALVALDDDDAASRIMELKGFGRWSAEIYLLFALGREDVFPADDLAVKVAMQRLHNLETAPDRPAMMDLARPWRPLRGCAAILLWHVYGAATLDN